MSFNDDFFWTGGGFSDWSGRSAGNFSTSGGSSGGSNNSDPDGWKRWIVILIAFVVALLIVFGTKIWHWIKYEFFQPDYHIEPYKEYCDTLEEPHDDSLVAPFDSHISVEPIEPVAPSQKGSKAAKPSSHRSHHSSRSYYYDDDEEDEDVRDKRQYDDYDDDEADDWE